METLLAIILIIVAYCASKSTEWRSNNRVSPPGYRTDFGKMNYDYTMYGKDYVHRKNIQGGYDVKIKNPKIGI